MTDPLHRVDLLFAAFVMALFLVGAAAEPPTSITAAGSRPMTATRHDYAAPRAVMDAGRDHAILNH